jgi:DNA-binding protein Fis
LAFTAMWPITRIGTKVQQFARKASTRHVVRKPKAIDPHEATDEVLDLQRTAGNRAVTSLLSPSTAPTSAARATSTAPSVVQRKELDADEIMAGLDTIPFIKKRLDETLNLGRGADRDDKAKQIRVSVKQVLDQYTINLKGSDKTKNHAMMMAAVLEAVAKAIAVNDLNDPALTPVLSVKLLELYRPEITTALGSMDNAGDALALTQALVADDPVGLFMHRELHIDEAARRVRQMAFAAGKKPPEMMELLRQRFEMQMGSLSKRTSRPNTT